KCKAKADCLFQGAPPMSDCCNSLCVDLTASPDNCGACGRSCGGGKLCCNAACIDTTSDVKNCGGCGKTCALPTATAGCAASAWTVASCNAGFGDRNKQAMDGCEVDVTTSVSNCGACAMVCPTPPGATAACAMGVCGVGMCNAGLADCDKMSMNGCES